MAELNNSGTKEAADLSSTSRQQRITVNQSYKSKKA
eukprot:CAMPEP_0185593690 /NCGR_PEP_ID=MMETSP0434-20130131/72293_1 /TAXON_ID=626734 ORGANISM="Favella taraikaensis, Strain Fe Narragansett Bay" /NCGR_SAMPLE_ID=MMETSP0434 /ASSEMBLY_ACC=CAM_ASM_000379 /LENGTH=35 /DNA_ID= /DNA_START= /DNA_END= /DNA_ORIENTATION=